MPDKISKEDRSRTMRAIKSVSKLENKVATELWRKGVRFRRNVKTLFGKPDIAIKKYRIAIFIDSCFWHNCPIHGHMPKSNQEYWQKKLERNKNRDEEVTAFYLQKGWNVKRVWEHEVRNDFEQTIQSLNNFIDNIKGHK